MSATYVSAELRRLTITRAQGLCEYCLIAEEDTFYGCEVDHVISEKHGGPTDEYNLCLACVFCNQTKGSDIGSIRWEDGQFVRFFNPRLDNWADHFALVGSKIEGLTDIGMVTVRILGFNSRDRVLERRILQDMGRFPNPAALNRMRV